MYGASESEFILALPPVPSRDRHESERRRVSERVGLYAEYCQETSIKEVTHRESLGIVQPSR